MELLKNGAIRWMLLLALLVEIGYAVLNLASMPVFLREDRGFGEVQVAAILAVFLAAEALGKGPVGQWAQRYGTAPFLIFPPILTGLSASATLAASRFFPTPGTAAEFAFMAALRVVDGLAVAAFWPCAFAWISEQAPDRKRQQALGMLNACYLVGIALAFPLGGLFEDRSAHVSPWAGAHSGGIALAAAVFGLAAVAAIPFARSGHVRPHASEAGASTLQGLWETARRIPAILGLAAITFAAIGLPMPILKLFAIDEFGLSGAGFGLVVLPGALMLAVLSVPVSAWGGRIGVSRSVHLGLLLCTIGMGWNSVGAAVPAMRSLTAIAPGAALVGIGFLLAIPAWLAAVGNLDPERRTANLGVAMAAQGAGAIVGALAGGALYQNVGRYAPFVACAMCLLIGYVVSLRVVRER